MVLFDFSGGGGNVTSEEQIDSAREGSFVFEVDGDGAGWRYYWRNTKNSLCIHGSASVSLGFKLFVSSSWFLMGRQNRVFCS